MNRRGFFGFLGLGAAAAVVAPAALKEAPFVHRGTATGTWSSKPWDTRRYRKPCKAPENLVQSTSRDVYLYWILEA